MQSKDFIIRKNVEYELQGIQAGMVDIIKILNKDSNKYK